MRNASPVVLLLAFLAMCGLACRHAPSQSSPPVAPWRDKAAAPENRHIANLDTVYCLNDPQRIEGSYCSQTLEVCLAMKRQSPKASACKIQYHPTCFFYDQQVQSGSPLQQRYKCFVERGQCQMAHDTFEVSGSISNMTSCLIQ